MGRVTSCFAVLCLGSFVCFWCVMLVLPRYFVVLPLPFPGRVLPGLVMSQPCGQSSHMSNHLVVLLAKESANKHVPSVVDVHYRRPARHLVDKQMAAHIPAAALEAQPWIESMTWTGRSMVCFNRGGVRRQKREAGGDKIEAARHTERNASRSTVHNARTVTNRFRLRWSEFAWSILLAVFVGSL